MSSKGIDTNGFTKDSHVISKRIMITIGSCRTKMVKDQKIPRRKCRKNNSSHSKKKKIIIMIGFYSLMVE